MLGPGRRRSATPRAYRAAAVVVVTALGLVGLLPLFGGPGYEAALAAGLLVPGVTAVAAAWRSAQLATEPLPQAREGAWLGLFLGVLAVAVSLAHGLRSGFCDAAEGLAMLLLGPVPGAVLAGAVGALAGALARGRRRPRLVATALALAAPAAGVVVSLLRFWTSPMVFAFDPFFGVFAGPLYDVVVEPLGRLATYRAGTAASLVFWLALAACLEAGASGRPRLAPQRRWPAALAALALVGSLAHTVAGPTLGHWQTTASLRVALGRELSGERCTVVHSADVPSADARLLLTECEAHLPEIERWLDVRGPERVTVWLFAGAEEKGRLLGAARTQIAKPWRAEVYVQASGFPHPVLGHELAHVVAGAAGRGPFRVAGPLGGWVPDPGRIEGVAEAAVPEEDDELAPEDWAAAMRRLGLLPPLERVFRLGFLGEPAARAYTVAGAFVAHVHREHGPAAVRRWYGGEDLAALTGASWGELERRWHESLERRPLSDDVLALAAARFDRPAIFQRRCPRVVDRLDRDAAARLEALDPEGARRRYEELLRLDPGHFGARLGLARCRSASGDSAAYRDALRTLSEDPAYGVVLRSHAREALADAELVEGLVAESLADYEAVLAAPLDEDRRRSVEVKRDAGARGAVAGVTSPETEVARRLLAGAPGGPRDPTLGGVALGRFLALEPGGLPRYLLARQHVQARRWSEADAELRAALARGLEGARLQREAWRLVTIVACARGDHARVAEGVRGYEAVGGGPAPRRDGLRAFARRCGITTPGS